MHILTTLLATILISVASAFSFYNYVPLSVFESFNKPQVLGSTITTILGTDSISGSRTVINTNFTNLNNDKMEISTTTLPLITTLANLSTVGTITTGTWSADAIAVNKGGTGTTSPSTYMVMLGNGANGLAMASTTGTAGQAFISNGAGAYPSWQDSVVNEAIAYDWTGEHSFAATTTFSGETIQATSTITTIIGKSFGGTGVDGALSCTTGTTSIDLGLASTTEKNYTSISITGDCLVNFTNPAPVGGSLIIMKSQGDVTITSTNNPAIDLRSIGGAAGVGASGGDGDNQNDNGNGGGGGGSMISAGVGGNNGTNGGSLSGGTSGSGFGKWLYSQTALGGGTFSASLGAGGVGGTSPTLDTTYAPSYLKFFAMPGGGGSGGSSGDDTSNNAASGSAGGKGGGALYMEVGGKLNITSTINAAGSNSSATLDAKGGCGGGGGGGSIQIFYNYLIANSGTYTVTAGSGNGGVCSVTGGNGGTGYSSVKQNIAF